MKLASFLAGPGVTFDEDLKDISYAIGRNSDPHLFWRIYRCILGQRWDHPRGHGAGSPVHLRKRSGIGGFGKAAEVPCIENGCCNYDYNTEILIKMRMLTFDGLKHNRLLS